MLDYTINQRTATKNVLWLLFMLDGSMLDKAHSLVYGNLI